MAASEALHGLSDAEPPSPLQVLIAAPRGFCAGVDRAIQIVELALERFGAPVYVRHEIVHNRFVVDRLKASARCSSMSSTKCPTTGRWSFPPTACQIGAGRGAEPRARLCRRDLPAGFQGSPPGAAADRGRPPHPVHRPCRPSRSDRHLRPGAGGRDHAGRDGRGRRARSTLPTIDTSPSSRRPRCRSTTRRRSSRRSRRAFPAIRAPRSEDICYATSNRQAAVKAIAPECDRMLVIGAPNSSNSLRLAEVAERMGVPARLIERAADIDWDWLGQPPTIGLTAAHRPPRSWCAKSSTRSPNGSRSPRKSPTTAPSG